MKSIDDILNVCKQLTVYACPFCTSFSGLKVQQGNWTDSYTGTFFLAVCEFATSLYDSRSEQVPVTLLWLQGKRTLGIFERKSRKYRSLMENDTAFTLKTSYDRKREIKMFLDNLSSAILDLCDSYKLSYELCDISSRYFGDIARGKTAPTILTLEKLCIGFDLTPNDLLLFSAICREEHSATLDR